MAAIPAVFNRGKTAGGFTAFPASSTEMVTIDTSGNLSSQSIPSGSGNASVHVVNGRLTVSTATPLPTTNVTAASTIYFTPCGGNQIRLYDGTQWVYRTFTEASLSLSGLTSGRVYDVFGYWTGSDLALDLGTVWTNSTTRATDLGTQDGWEVKSGDATRLYLGSIYTTGATTTEFTVGNAAVFNRYNPMDVKLKAIESTDSWTYASTTIRQVRGFAGNKICVLNGLAKSGMKVNLRLDLLSLGNVLYFTGIGYDSTTASIADISTPSHASGTLPLQAWSEVEHYTGLGYHEYPMLEWCGSATTKTIYGDAGRTDGGTQSGLLGRVMI